VKCDFDPGLFVRAPPDEGKSPAARRFIRRIQFSGRRITTRAALWLTKLPKGRRTAHVKVSRRRPRECDRSCRYAYEVDRANSDRSNISAAPDQCALDVRNRGRDPPICKWKGRVTPIFYLYRDDGKFLRQLTTDNSVRMSIPISRGREMIVFTREKGADPLEFWSGGVHRWQLQQTRFGARLVQTDQDLAVFYKSRAPGAENARCRLINQRPVKTPVRLGPRTAAGMNGERKSLQSARRIGGIILRERPSDPDDQAKASGMETLCAALSENWNPGRLRNAARFLRRVEILTTQRSGSTLLLEGLMRVASSGASKQ